MARKKISQKDARQFLAERDEAIARLDALLRRGGRTYGGTHIGYEVGITSPTLDRLRTAKQLGYAIFAVVSDEQSNIDFRAMKPGEV